MTIKKTQEVQEINRSCKQHHKNRIVKTVSYNKIPLKIFSLSTECFIQERTNHRRILKIVPAKTRPFLQFNPFLPSETCRSIFATLVPVGHKKHHLRYQLGKQLLTFSFNKPTNVIIAFAQLQMNAIFILSKKNIEFYDKIPL